MAEPATTQAKYYKNSIAKKLTLFILLFSSIITLVGTSLQLYLDYSEDVEFIRDNMYQVDTSHLPSIINNLWVSDIESLETELTSILELPDMQHIQIIKGEEVICSFGTPQKDDIIYQKFPLEYSFKGKIVNLGTLHVVASLKGVYQRLYDKVLVILTTQAIKTFLVSLFILFLFYYLVGRHLGVMARYANTLDLDNLDVPLVLRTGKSEHDYPNELSTVASALNSMRVNLKKDIDARLEVEEELRKSHALLNAVIEGTTDAIFLKDLDGRYLLANKAALLAVGKPAEEVIGKSDAELFPEMSARVISEVDSRVIGFGETLLTEERLETAYGDTFWLVNKSPFRDKNNNIIGLIGISRNITEYKRIEDEKSELEDRLRQAHKLEAIGTLAGGIAHDFNNILSIILGYAEMAKEDAPPDSRFQGDLDQILKAVYRAKDLVQQILTFSRQAQVEKVPIRPQVIVKEAIKMLRSSIPSTIEIQERIAPDCGVIKADPTQLHQILMNICTNAFQAMENKGGILEVELQVADTIPPELAERQTADENGFVKLSIRDTGHGIEPDAVGKIFDPFFTTKEKGKGTGMGLAITYGIIQEYGGLITVDSQLGKGTTFQIYLPLAKGETSQVLSTTADVPEGSERILFVDDEEPLAVLGKDILETLGYHVSIKQNSIEALEDFQNQPDKFDLVITDQTMPGLTGLELAQKILQIRPDIPIILSTGYSNLVNEELAKAQGVRGFVFKPVTKKTLAKLIRQVLDGDGFVS